MARGETPTTGPCQALRNRPGRYHPPPRSLNRTSVGLPASTWCSPWKGLHPKKPRNCKPGSIISPRCFRGPSKNSPLPKSTPRQATSTGSSALCLARLIPAARKSCLLPIPMTAWRRCTSFRLASRWERPRKSSSCSAKSGMRATYAAKSAVPLSDCPAAGALVAAFFPSTGPASRGAASIASIRFQPRPSRSRWACRSCIARRRGASSFCKKWPLPWSKACAQLLLINAEKRHAGTLALATPRPGRATV